MQGLSSRAIPFGLLTNRRASQDGPWVKTPRPFEIVAHRGLYMTEADEMLRPENTTAAYEQAAKQEYSAEMDAQALLSPKQSTANVSPKVVLFHNYTIGDTSQGNPFHYPGQPADASINSQKVSETDWETLQTARVDVDRQKAYVSYLRGKSAGELPQEYVNARIPDFKEALKAYLVSGQTGRIYIETKLPPVVTAKGLTNNNNLEEKVVQTLRELQQDGLDPYNRVVVISFSIASLKKLKQLDVENKIAKAYDMPCSYDYYHAGLLKQKTITPAIQQGLKISPRLMKQYLGISSIHPWYQDTTPGLIKAAHNAGLRVVPFVYGETWAAELKSKPSLTEEELRVLKEKGIRVPSSHISVPALIDMGVDGVITNAPERIRKLLESRDDVYEWNNPFEKKAI